MLTAMDTPNPEVKVSREFEKALRLMADRKDRFDPVTMREIARLLVGCSDAEKCAAHFLMDNNFVGQNQYRRFHWLLTKSCTPRCLPTDRRLWRELLAVKREQERSATPDAGER